MGRHGTELFEILACPRFPSVFNPCVRRHLRGFDTDNAATNDYETSRVVDLKGTRKTDVETIAKALGIATGSLPVGETASDSADFLIIFGKDKI